MRDAMGKRITMLESVNAYAAKLRDETIPKTRKQMMKHAKSNEWQIDEKREIESFAKLKVYEVVERPRNEMWFCV